MVPSKVRGNGSGWVHRSGTEHRWSTGEVLSLGCLTVFLEQLVDSSELIRNVNGYRS